MKQSTFGRWDVFRPFPLTFGRWNFAVVFTECPQGYCGSVLHFLPACPPLEGGTISRVNSAPSEGEDVSENVAAIPVCVGEASYSFGRSRKYMRFGYPFGRSRRVKVSGNRATMLVGYCHDVLLLSKEWRMPAFYRLFPKE